MRSQNRNEHVRTMQILYAPTTYFLIGLEYSAGKKHWLAARAPGMMHFGMLLPTFLVTASADVTADMLSASGAAKFFWYFLYLFLTLLVGPSPCPDCTPMPAMATQQPLSNAQSLLRLCGLAACVRPVIGMNSGLVVTKAYEVDQILLLGETFLLAMQATASLCASQVCLPYCCHNIRHPGPRSTTPSTGCCRWCCRPACNSAGAVAQPASFYVPMIYWCS